MKTETFSTLTSTAELAEKYILQNKYDDHFVILAESQESGRGRKDNFWHSPKGGLYINIVLNHLSTQKSFTLYIGYCILKTLHTLTQTDIFRIKWPNDIYLYDKKICGLICSQYTQHHRTSIGIGINTNSHTQASYGVHSIADILNIHLENCIYLDNIVSAVLNGLETFEQTGLPFFYDYYTQHDFLKNKYISVDIGSQIHTGYYQCINPDGALILKTNDNEILTIYSGSIVSS